MAVVAHDVRMAHGSEHLYLSLGTQLGISYAGFETNSLDSILFAVGEVPAAPHLAERASPETAEASKVLLEV
jgi:hypothetical protein